VWHRQVRICLAAREIGKQRVVGLDTPAVMLTVLRSQDVFDTVVQTQRRAYLHFGLQDLGVARSSRSQVHPLLAGYTEVHAARSIRRRRTNRTINHLRFIEDRYAGFATHASYCFIAFPETVNARQSMIHSDTPLYLATFILSVEQNFARTNLLDFVEIPQQDLRAFVT